MLLKVYTLIEMSRNRRKCQIHSPSWCPSADWLNSKHQSREFGEDKTLFCQKMLAKQILFMGQIYLFFTGLNMSFYKLALGNNFNQLLKYQPQTESGMVEKEIWTSYDL